MSALFLMSIEQPVCDMLRGPLKHLTNTKGCRASAFSTHEIQQF